MSRSWQIELSESLRTLDALRRALGLKEHDLPPSPQAEVEFSVFVPRPYLERIRPGDPQDPLLLQVLARPEESSPQPEGLSDPLKEADYRARPGVLQKYAGRVLVVPTGVCAIHCRYCFRRHYPYAEGFDLEGLREELEASQDPLEVILSGGDPWTLSPAKHAALLELLARHPKVHRLRVHTRTPVVLPARVDPELLTQIEGFPHPVVVVLHVNHAREIDSEVRVALQDLKQAGATLLNQSVLLRGVNDRLEDLVALSEALFAAGVLPYYLHLFDPVRGAMHFQVPDPEAQALWSQLRDSLPGYLVPRLIREVPGRASKTWVV